MPTSARTLTEAQKLDLAWLAGFVDGEGSIGVRKNPRGSGWSPIFTLWNTCTKSLLRARGIIESHGIVTGGQTDAPKLSALAKKPIHRVVITKTSDVISLLELIKSYSITKRDNYDALLSIYSDRRSGSRWAEDDVCAIDRYRREFMPRSV